MPKNQPADLVVYGAGGLAREIVWLCQQLGQYHLLGYAVTDASHRPAQPAAPIWGYEADLLACPTPLQVILAVGDARHRLAIWQRLQAAPHLRFPILTHPSNTWDAATCTLAEGVILFPGTRLTVNVHIGAGTYGNQNCSIGHDVRIGTGCVINSGANISGNVTIGDGVLIGSGATVLQGLTIGDGARLGAGAVLTRNLPPGETWVGVPASKVEAPPVR